MIRHGYRIIRLVHYRTCFIYFISFFFLDQSFADERPEQPNIILVLTDDLGWQDVGCYDVDEPSPMETPHIDALAQRGIQFWQAYSPAPTCAPTRCAILSGIHPARAQKTHVVGGAPPAPHAESWPMMAPWYSGRMPLSTESIARALGNAGYRTGHCGKWHIAINHHSFPQPKDHGFHWTRSNLGVTRKMKPNRLEGFATDHTDDPYQLNEDGFCTHQNSLDALAFLEENKAQPFFLYYATWLVHTPIHTRNEKLLDKYCKKLGVERPIDDPESWTMKGQKNPFYCAMVEELDHYMGDLFSYLDETEDSRWPGHKLFENTYLIFTSDNGGMEKDNNDIITDNYPLDRGKISLMEGGTRVPLIIVGPDLPKGVQSQVMVNGLDFFPTILNWAGAKGKEGQAVDGLDLTTLLRKDPTSPDLIKNSEGKVRTSLMWHFPNSAALQSTLRVGDYKLVKNYNHVGRKHVPPFELYRLYDSSQSLGHRVDLEEAQNLAEKMPEKVKAMNAQLSTELTEMKASYPYYNPDFPGKRQGKETVPTPGKLEISGSKLAFTYQENGAKIERIDLLYTTNAGEKDEEWFRQEMKLDAANHTATCELPEGASHLFFNLIDENNFLVSYPKIDAVRTRGKRLPSRYALPIKK